MSYFEDLKVWQKARDLAVRIHRITKTKGFDTDPELRSCLRRVSVDVACQIADGSVRGSEKASLVAYFNAKGLLAQLDTLAELSHMLGQMDESPRDVLRQESETVAKMLSGLIKAQSDPERKGRRAAAAAQGAASY